MKVEEKEFSIPATDGQMIRGVFRDTGQGAVGIFFHGLLSDAEGTKAMFLWNQAERFNRSWIRFDMRAHGKSDGTFDEFSMSRALEDTHLVLQLFENRPKVLVGSSMGGWVAAQTALDRVWNIQGTVLIAPAFNFMNRIYLDLTENEQQQWKETGFRKIESPYPDCDFTLSYDAVVDSRNYNLFERNIEYDHPVKILHGRLDDVVPVNRSFEFQKHAQSAIEVLALNEGDHRLTDHGDVIENSVNEIWPR